MLGRTLDRYRLLEQVGQGGMAVVYRAVDVSLDREVAVKVLHPHLAGHDEARARLQREAQAVARLRHDNILEIFAYSGPESKDSYIVTEFIHGPTLRAFLDRQPLPLPELGAMIVYELTKALSCAHAAGILHRDIKPENVMIRRDGTIVLCDFGIAHVVDKERMTATGQLLGSPAYMAPEHIEGRPLDFRSDVFSLGVVLYQLITGELPFRGRNPHETLKRITEGRFTPPEELQPLCSASLSRIVERALRREPAARYADIAQMRAELRAALDESGMAEPARELRAFFAAPDDWVARARPRIAAALLALGRRLRAEGRTAAALAAWNRARLLQPDDPAAPALIRAVAQRGRLGRRAAATVLLLGAALLGAGAYRSWHRARAHHRPPSLAKAPGAGQPLAREVVPPAWTSVPPAAVDPSAGLLSPPEPPAAADLAPGPPPPPEPPAAVPPAAAPIRVRPPRPTARPALPRRVVRLAPWPKAVQVSLNGRRLGDYGTDVTTVELPEGPNELLFENPACYSERVVIPADADPGEIRLRLRWKPALLLVRSRDGADVIVEGRLGRAGQVLALPVRSDDGRATVEVRVSAAGHKTAVQTVEVRANQLITLEVPLEPG